MKAKLRSEPARTTLYVEKDAIWLAGKLGIDSNLLFEHLVLMKAEEPAGSQDPEVVAARMRLRASLESRSHSLDTSAPPAAVTRKTKAPVTVTVPVKTVPLAAGSLPKLYRGHQVVMSSSKEMMVHVFDNEAGADRNVPVKIFDENPKRFDQALEPWT